MKRTSLVVGLVLLIAAAPGLAQNLASQIKVAIDAGMQKPGMEPGTYECAGGHLHVAGTLQNMNDVAVKMIKLEGKVFDTDGALLGTASEVRKRELKPGAKADFDLEFVKVTGPKIEKVKKSEIKAVDAQPAR